MFVNYSTLTKLLIVFLLFVTSYQQLFAAKFSLLDEVLLFGLIAYLIVFVLSQSKVRNINNLQIIFCGYGVLCIVSILANQRSVSVLQLFNNFKPLIVITLFMLLKFYKHQYNSIMNIFLLINIPSIVWGVLQYFNIVAVGKQRYEMSRLDGLSGHPINFGFILLAMIVWLHNKYFYNVMVKIIIVFLTILMIRTFSRLPLAFLILYFIVYYYLRINKKLRIIMVLTMLMIGVSFVMSYRVDPFSKYLSDDINNTIRIYSLIKTPEIMSDSFKNLFMGVGVEQFVANSDNKLFYRYNFSQNVVNFAMTNKASAFESHAAKQLIETGIIGTMLFYGFFICLFFRQKELLGKYFIAILLLSSVLNPFYSIPFIYITALNVE